MKPRFPATLRRCLIACAVAAAAMWTTLDDGAARQQPPAAFDALMHSGVRLREEIRATRCYAPDTWWVLHDRFRDWRHQVAAWEWHEPAPVVDARGPDENPVTWLGGRIDIALRELEGRRCPLVHDIWHVRLRLPR